MIYTNCKRRDFKVGDTVYLLEPVDNGEIKIGLLQMGKVVNVQNHWNIQVWYPEFGESYQSSFPQLLDITNTYNKHGRLDGIVCNMFGKNLAASYKFNDEFNPITIPEDAALTIPFFTPDESKLLDSNHYKHIDDVTIQVKYYQLIDMINNIEDSFMEWTSGLDYRPLTEEELEELEELYSDSTATSCLTDESYELYSQKRYELNLQFARVTNVYYDFKGGINEIQG